MLSGLTRFIKIVLPKGLFYRSLIIVAAPIIILQLIVSIVFFDSIWIKANKGMTRSLVSEIETLVDVYNQSDKNQINYITSIYKKNYDYVINVLEKEILSDSFERKFSPMDRSLRRELKSTFGSENYWFSTTNYMDIVEEEEVAIMVVMEVAATAVAIMVVMEVAATQAAIMDLIALT